MFRLWTHRLRVVGVLLAGLCAAAGNAQVPDPGTGNSSLASRQFRDQFGYADSLDSHRGAPVVVVVVGVARLAMIEHWERDLRERLPDVRFLNIADLPADAPVDLDRTAATLRKRVPAGVAVLLDPAREWATAFKLDTTLPNLLIFDAEGRLAARFRGRWSAELADQVAGSIAERPSAPDGRP